MAPAEAKQKVGALFKGAMKGRTLYVVPYIMGPVDSPYSQLGVEITDSPYVVANMRIMTRMGAAGAATASGSSDNYVKGLHSLGDLSPERRFIMHFPEERLIWSVGSGYGGNALLGKKCFALRIASFMARQEGWLAEHMLIVGIEDPQGERHYVAGGVPERLRQDQSGHARAAGQPEGLESVDGRRRHLLDAPRPRRPPVGDQSGGGLLRRRAGHVDARPTRTPWRRLRKNSIFTNVAVTDDNGPWWEGIDGAGARASDRLAGQRLAQGLEREGGASELALHRAGVAVPVDLAALGGSARRADLGHRVRRPPRPHRAAGLQAFDWNHGVFVGASVASETTAAQSGAVGVVRRDPMAMLPFCGYNMGDYFGHWLHMGTQLERPAEDLPRQLVPAGRATASSSGRASARICAPCAGCSSAATAAATATRSSRRSACCRRRGAIDTAGLDLEPGALDELLTVTEDDWRGEADNLGEFFAKFGDRLPGEMNRQRHELIKRLG